MGKKFTKTVSKRVKGFRKKTIIQSQSLARLEGDTNILTNKRNRF